MLRRAFLAMPLAASATLRQSLLAGIERLPVVDTHEHFPSEAKRVKSTVDLFTLAGHYLINDAVSAGMSPDAKTWADIEPYWKYVRSTGYGQALAIAIRDIYGVAEISSANVEKINSAIRAANTPGVYRRILQDRCRIAFAVNDAVVDPADHPLLVQSWRFDHYLSPSDMSLVERLTDSEIGGLDDLERVLATRFDYAVKHDMRAVKLALAYERDLHFDQVARSDAADAFNRYLNDHSKKPPRTLVDYMVHAMLRLAQENNIPVQIHTGMLAGNGGELERTRPSLLTNLFRSYPRVRFNLFHAGYPYVDEFTALVKQWPNVYGDLCWTHIVSPSAARRVLADMLDSVPANKIMGFGGDYRYPELSYGHLVIARRNIASVLAERVADGLCSEDKALELARWMLHDNAAAMFGKKRG